VDRLVYPIIRRYYILVSDSNINLLFEYEKKSMVTVAFSKCSKIWNGKYYVYTDE